MRAVATLASIKKHPVEHGYLINNKTGKVSQEVVGEKGSVNVHEGLGIRGETNEWRVQRRKPATILHNHPSGIASPLSPGDYTPGLPVVAVDRRGNMYRGKSKLAIPSDRVEARDFQTRISDDVHDQVTKKWEGSTSGKPAPYRSNHFLRLHYANKKMAQAGVQTYRAKLSSATQTADRVMGGAYAKATDKAYRKEYFKLPSGSRLQEKLPHPGHRKTILSPKAIAQASRPWEERHPLKHLQERRKIVALASQPTDWMSKLKMKAGVKVKPLNVTVPPVSKAVAEAAARQATRGNRIVLRRL